MFSSPSLMPNVSRANSRSRRSAPRVECGGANADGLRLGHAALGSHEPKRARERGFHVASIDDEIEHAALDEEFTALESLGELLPDRLFDDAWARESNQGLRFADVEIAEHREAGRDAAG